MNKFLGVLAATSLVVAFAALIVSSMYGWAVDSPLSEPHRETLMSVCMLSFTVGFFTGILSIMALGFRNA
jgi:hypothetical protein